MLTSRLEPCSRFYVVFKRNQIEEAIAKILERGASQPSSVLRTRMKRLLEMDRALDREQDASGSGPAPFAFFSGEPPGRGREVWHSGYEAFGLTVGLILMSHGWRQSFVVAVMRRVRADLEKEHARTLAQDPEWLFDQDAIRRSARAGDMAFDNQDPVLLTIGSKPMRALNEQEGPVACAVCRGPARMAQFMDAFRGSGPLAWTSFELVGLAHRLSQSLAETKPRKRGARSWVPFKGGE